MAGPRAGAWTAADHDRYGPGISEALREEFPGVWGWALAKSITGVDPAKPRGGGRLTPDQVESDGRGGLKAVEAK
jgi:hypothetical protein